MVFNSGPIVIASTNLHVKKLSLPTFQVRIVSFFIQEVRKGSRILWRK
ncbi:MAG: hypothetical protein CMIDDMOC_00608 [Sodalis sp. Fle]|nr:MAG: hypothetical protein CMIDDMOC_00608 [Sodalis sp. Fle]